MWYRFAQAGMTYSWGKTESGDALYITSGKTKDGFQAQPDILLMFKYDNSINTSRIATPFKESISSKEVSRIFQTVQANLIKYPAGWLAERLGNDYQIQIVAELFDPKLSQGFELQGDTVMGDPVLTVKVNSINSALDHEIGHALDNVRINKLPLGNIPFIKNFLGDQKDGTYMAPSEYGRTNNAEAFAEAFELIAQKGVNYRLPNNTKQNIDSNRLLDYVAKEITRKGYKTALEDFKKNIQLQNNSLSNATPYADLNNYRISTLIGGFQSAIDRFKGDKQAYGLDIISNKQKINDIVAYINKNQSEFFTKPATEEEIEAAKNYIKEKVDKGSFYQTVVQERSDYTVTTDAMIDIGEYIPKSIVDFLSTANFKLYKDGSRLPNSVKVVNRGRPAEMSKEDYNKINNFLKTIKWENLIKYNSTDGRWYFIRNNFNLPSSTTSNKVKIGTVYSNLITTGGIFPDLNHPEDFLYFDYKITPNGYTLDTNSVITKIKKHINRVDSITSDEAKLSIEKEVLTLIQAYAKEYQKLLYYKQRDPKNLFPFEFIKNKLTPVNYFELAKKAIPRMLSGTSQSMFSMTPDNLQFMKIYNSDFLNDRQKQELLIIYRAAKKQYDKDHGR
jgi:hypothetical protein